MNKEASLKSLAEKIKAARLAKGLSQLQLGHKVNKDQQSIQRLESGKFNPTYFYLMEIAEGLDIPLVELLEK